MKKAIGRDVKVSTDPTGGFVSLEWDCPYCGEYNAGLYFSSNVGALSGDFEIDHECDECGKMVTIECRNAGELFN